MIKKNTSFWAHIFFLFTRVSSFFGFLFFFVFSTSAANLIPGESTEEITLNFFTMQGIPENGKLFLFVPNEFAMDDIPDLIPHITNFSISSTEYKANIHQAYLKKNIITIQMDNTIFPSGNLRVEFDNTVFDMNPILPGEYAIAWEIATEGRDFIEKGHIKIPLKNEVQVRAQIQLAPPANAEFLCTTDGIKITWNQSPHSALSVFGGYKIYYKESSNTDFSNYYIVTDPPPFYHDNNFVNTSWDFRIAAFDTLGNESRFCDDCFLIDTLCMGEDLIDEDDDDDDSGGGGSTGGGRRSVCGNGIRQIGEQCDDGNRINGDGCSSFCKTETVVLECGNGNLETGEQCDDGNLATQDGCSDICEYEYVHVTFKVKADPQARAIIDNTPNLWLHSHLILHHKSLSITEGQYIKLDMNGLGSYEGDVLMGIYDTGLNGDGHLTQGISDVLVDGSQEEILLDYTFGETRELLGGDMHDNEYVNAIDLAKILSVYKTTDIENPSDLTKEGYINAIDIAIPLWNYKKQGITLGSGSEGRFE